MARRLHDQRPDPRLMVCLDCKLGQCENCIDRLRALYTTDWICTCTRKLHAEKRDGEPTLNQVEDPFTGDIHAPGLVVGEDGQVKFRDGCDPFSPDN